MARPISVNPETLQAAWKRAREGFAEVQENGRLRNVNPAFAAIVGYAPSELVEKTFSDITHPDDVSYDEEMVRQVIEGKVESYPMTKRYLTKDNDIVWVRLIASKVPTEGSKALLLGQVQVLDQTSKPELIQPVVNPSKVLKDHWKKIAAFMGTVTAGISSGLYYLKQQADAQALQAEQIEQLKTLLEALVK